MTFYLENFNSLIMGRKTKNKTRYSNAEIKHRLAIKAMVYFQKNGISNFSMSKMALDLSMSKTTIYNHYGSKYELLEAALNYKLGVISEYETVLENLTLPYTERYRKAILFYCVQLYDISSQLMKEIKQDYPQLWEIVLRFNRKTYRNLRDYYSVGKDIGVFKAGSNPILLSLDDQQFFQMLGINRVMQEHNIEVLDAFNHHFNMKFTGIIDPSYELSKMGRSV